MKKFICTELQESEEKTRFMFGTVIEAEDIKDMIRNYEKKYVNGENDEIEADIEQNLVRIKKIEGVETTLRENGGWVMRIRQSECYLYITAL